MRAGKTRTGWARRRRGWIQGWWQWQAMGGLVGGGGETAGDGARGWRPAAAAAGRSRGGQMSRRVPRARARRMAKTRCGGDMAAPSDHLHTLETPRVGSKIGSLSLCRHAGACYGHEWGWQGCVADVQRAHACGATEGRRAATALMAPAGEHRRALIWWPTTASAPRPCRQQQGGAQGAGQAVRKQRGRVETCGHHSSGVRWALTLPTELRAACTCLQEFAERRV
ncbi:MAG: hypothetical protein J3K34DRAFT_401491 [Monoraphidium minutum]|nr:MAG: hypothetical protein J3K34DRAFT_401491 [Monoraphidium minutum]